MQTYIDWRLSWFSLQFLGTGLLVHLLHVLLEADQGLAIGIIIVACWLQPG